MPAGVDVTWIWEDIWISPWKCHPVIASEINLFKIIVVFFCPLTGVVLKSRRIRPNPNDLKLGRLVKTTLTMHCSPIFHKTWRVSLWHYINRFSPQERKCNATQLYVAQSNLFHQLLVNKVCCAFVTNKNKKSQNVQVSDVCSSHSNPCHKKLEHCNLCSFWKSVAVYQNTWKTVKYKKSSQ